METIDYYNKFGIALHLLAKSEYHKHHHAYEYLMTEIWPPILFNQNKIYFENNTPIGLVTWAWINEDVKCEIHQSGRALTGDEWQSGDSLFFNDFIAPFGHAKVVAKDLKYGLFKDQVATSIHRNVDGGIGRIQTWIGTDVKNSAAKEIVGD